MVHWIRRGTRLFAGVIFFIVLINSLITSRSLELSSILTACAFGLFAAILCWFLGFVICDIVVKGMITHIEDGGVDALIEGGLVQQVKMMQDEFVPGGKEMPFSVEGSHQSDGETSGKKG